VFNPHINIKNDLKKDDSSNTEQQEQPQEESKKSDEESKCCDEEELKFYEDPEIEKYLSVEEDLSKKNIIEFNKMLLDEFGITRFRAIDVDHCPQSFAVLIEHKDGWKYVYSGDTRPH